MPLGSMVELGATCGPKAIVKAVYKSVPVGAGVSGFAEISPNTAPAFEVAGMPVLVAELPSGEPVSVAVAAGALGCDIPGKGRTLGTLNVAPTVGMTSGGAVYVFAVVGLASPVLEVDTTGLPFSDEEAAMLVAPTTGDWLPSPWVGTTAVVVGTIPPLASVTNPVSDDNGSDVTDVCPLAELCVSVGPFIRGAFARGGVIEGTDTEGIETDSCVSSCAVLDGDC